MINEYPYDTRRSGFGSFVLDAGKKKVKRVAWGLLAPIIIPVAIITLGAFVLAMALSLITNAGAAPELREDSDYYEAIAASVNPGDLVNSDQELDWGILKAAEFIIGSDRNVRELADRLGPEVTYSDFRTTVVRVGPDGRLMYETVSFRLVSEIRTYDTIYRYDYEFTDWGNEVTWERQEVERVSDKTKLNDALAWYAGGELDEVTVYLIEQTAYSFNTGEMSWSFGVLGSASEGQIATWPVTGVITSGFGYRIHPVYGSIQYHSGIDIAANTGTPIPAIERGKVILAGWSGGYGLCVMIEHEEGYVSVYGHCSRVLVNVGQNVRRGQTIAEVGSTGVSTGAHLHFEIRINGECVDPTPWME